MLFCFTSHPCASCYHHFCLHQWVPPLHYVIVESSLTSFTLYHQQSIIIITGGVDKKNKVLKDVLEYNPEEDKWTKVGQLAKPRYHHAASLVPKEIADYCV